MLQLNSVFKSKIVFSISIFIASMFIGFVLSIMDVVVQVFVYNDGTFIEMLHHNYSSFHHYVENILIFIFFFLFAIMNVIVANAIVKKNELIIDSERKYRRIAENTKDIIFRLRLPDFKYEFINKACGDITGYSAEEFAQDELLFPKIIHPDFKYGFIIDLKKSYDKDFLNENRFKITTKSGAEKYILQRNYNSYTEDNSFFIEGILIDVTDILNAEKEVYNKNIELETQNEELASLNEEITSQNDELHLTNDRLEKLNIDLRNRESLINAIFDKAPIAIQLFDANGFLIKFNKKTEELLNISNTTSFIGSFNILEPNESLPDWQLNYFKEVYNGKLMSLENVPLQAKSFGLEYINKNKVIYVDVNISPINDSSGKLIAVMSILIDVTARQYVECQKQLNMKRLLALLEINEMRDNLDTENILQKIISEAVSLTNSSFGFVSIPIENTDCHKLYFSNDIKVEDYIIPTEDNIYQIDRMPIAKDAFTNEKNILINSPNEIVGMSNQYTLKNDVVDNLICIPIVYNKSCVATITVVNKDGNYDNIDLTQLKLLAQSAWKTLKHNEMEVALIESEKQYRGLFENMIEGIAIHKIIYNEEGRAIDYQILDCNKAFSSHTGISCERAKGAYATELYKTDSAPFLDLYLNVAETNQTSVFEIYFAPMDKYFKISSFCLRKGYFVNIFENITENKKLELSLRRSEEQYRTLIDHTTEVIEKYDKDLKILFVNKAFEKFGRVRLDDVIGKRLGDLGFDKKLVAFWEKEMQKALNKQEIINTSYCMDIDNEVRHYEWTIVPEIRGNNAIAVYSFSKDVTDKVNTEKSKQQIAIAEKSAKIKQQFVANMSHEIRTPISGIIGIVDFLLKSELNVKQKEYLNLIQSSAETLHNIVNDVLLLSKFELGKIELVNHEIDLYAFVDELYNVFNSMPLRKVNIVKDIVDAPKYIKVDKNRLRQIMSNLISNALKFTKQGEVIIKVRQQENISKDRVLLKVEIIDTGVGIKSTNIDKLFKDFSQIEASKSKNYEGAGLGLSISKRFVDLMGGEIGVVSEENKGSNFWFTFECEIIEQLSHPNDNDDNKEIAENSLEGIRVLLVEDKYVNLIITQKMLEKLGCVVDIAKNGMEALNLYKPKKYDIVLMDIHMPIMDGLEATKQIKDRFYQDDICPIIALTADAMEGEEEYYRNEGMDDYLIKPATQRVLYEKIRKHLP